MKFSIYFPIVIVIIVLLVWYSNSNPVKNVNGFYFAKPSFLERSGLERQVFFFKNISGNKYYIYINFETADGVIINDFYKGEIHSKGGKQILDIVDTNQNVETVDSNIPMINNCLPCKTHIEIELTGNKLILKELKDVEPTVYSILYRDIEYTELANMKA